MSDKVRVSKNREMFRAIIDSLIKKYGVENIDKATVKAEGFDDKMAAVILMYIESAKKDKHE